MLGQLTECMKTVETKVTTVINTLKVFEKVIKNVTNEGSRHKKSFEFSDQMDSLRQEIGAVTLKINFLVLFILIDLLKVLADGMDDVWHDDTLLSKFFKKVTRLLRSTMEKLMTCQQEFEKDILPILREEGIKNDVYTSSSKTTFTFPTYHDEVVEATVLETVKKLTGEEKTWKPSDFLGVHIDVLTHKRKILLQAEKKKKKSCSKGRGAVAPPQQIKTTRQPQGLPLAKTTQAQTTSGGYGGGGGGGGQLPPVVTTARKSSGTQIKVSKQKSDQEILRQYIKQEGRNLIDKREILAQQASGKIPFQTLTPDGIFKSLNDRKLLSDGFSRKDREYKRFMTALSNYVQKNIILRREEREDELRRRVVNLVKQKSLTVPVKTSILNYFNSFIDQPLSLKQLNEIIKSLEPPKQKSSVSRGSSMKDRRSGPPVTVPRSSGGSGGGGGGGRKTTQPGSSVPPRPTSIRQQQQGSQTKTTNPSSGGGDTKRSQGPLPPGILDFINRRWKVV